MAELKRMEYIFTLTPKDNNGKDDSYFQFESVEKLIRCGGCRFFDSYPMEHTEGKCTRLGRMCCYDDFCSDAEEKDDG